jgi:hypothetical protein
VDVTAFEVDARYGAHLPVDAAAVEATVRIWAAPIDEPGVDVWLRLWTPRGATVAILREVSPATGDLLAGAVRLDALTVQCPAGRWTGGAREYELAVAPAAAPRDPGDELLAARLGVVVGGEVVARALIAVVCVDAAVAAAAELPTGWSPQQPLHVITDGPPAGGPCPGCGLRPGAGDRFCEACGRELGRGP